MWNWTYLAKVVIFLILLIDPFWFHLVVPSQWIRTSLGRLMGQPPKKEYIRHIMFRTSTYYMWMKKKFKIGFRGSLTMNLCHFVLSKCYSLYVNQNNELDAGKGKPAPESILSALSLLFWFWHVLNSLLKCSCCSVDQEAAHIHGFSALRPIISESYRDELHSKSPAGRGVWSRCSAKSL